MSFDVCIEVSLLSEPFIAVITLVRFVTRVQAHVRDQVTFLCEPFVTDFTGEWTVGLQLFEDAFVFCLTVGGRLPRASASGGRGHEVGG